METVKSDNPFESLKKSDRAFALADVSPQAIVMAWENRGFGLYNRRPAMYVIEPDKGRFNEYREDYDIRDILKSPDAYWFVGDDWRKQLADFICTEPLIEHPGVCFSQSGLSIEELVREAIGQKEKNAMSIKERNESISYDGDLRVLLVASSFTSSMKATCDDLVWAFGQESIPCSILSETNPSDRLSPLDLVRAVSDFKPTVFLSINWSRQDIPPYLSDKLPVWSIVTTKESSALKGPMNASDRVFPSTQDLLKTCLQAGWSEDRTHLFPPAVNTSTFRHPCKDDENEEAVKTMTTDVAIFHDLFHPSQTTSDSLKKIFAERIVRLAIPAKRLVRAGVTTLTYGQGWTKYPRLIGTWSGVPTSTGLSRAMRYAKITLHIDPAEGNLSHTVLQAILSGSLPIVKHSPKDYPDLVGKLFVVYHEDKEMVPLVRKWLADEELRRSFVMEAQTWVKSEHCFRNRVKMLKNIYVKA